MAIPVAYNFRNLVVRKTTTVMTALGIGLTVAVLVADLALVNGLRQAFQATGQPLAALEVVTVISLAGLDSPNGMSLSVRGLDPVGLELRNVHLVRGRWFQA